MKKDSFQSHNFSRRKWVAGLKNSWSEHTKFSIVTVLFLFSLLAVLAVLQYRWSGQLSRAEFERMHSSLLASMDQFRLHFNNELQQPLYQLQPDPAVLVQEDWRSYAEKCMSLLDMPDFRTVSKIFIWSAGNPGTTRLDVLNRKIKNFEPVSWPPGLVDIKNSYQNLFSNTPNPPPPIRPFTAITPDRTLYLLQPLFVSASSSDTMMKERFWGFLLVELNSEIILGELIPELSGKYFSSGGVYVYQIAIADSHSPGSFLFQSDPGLNADDFLTPDARIYLLDTFREPPGPGGPNTAMERKPPPEPMRDPSFASGRLPPPRLRRNREPGPDGRKGPSWELLAKHRMGSLEAAVTATRRRNLAISFGSLLLLAASITLILVSAKRAQRLTRLQIDFVAGISHELRTPLAVICSAGDNLAEGVVTQSGEAVQNYGRLIRGEGRKLANMVEQVMQFAGMKAGRRNYNIRPLQVNDIVAATLEQERPTVQASGFSVETSLSEDLPSVRIDSSAMNQVLLNLIQNAIKYSGKSRWIGIRTERYQSRRETGVILTVEDKGIGIDSKDISHIFDPFYRGQKAISGQIHGNGLGLFFVRETLTAMGANIRVESNPGGGSAFIIRLPGFPAAENREVASTGKG